MRANWRTIPAAAAVLALLAAPAAHGSPGDPDVDFGGTGTVVLSTTGSFPEKFGVDGEVDASGRVLTAGTAQSGVDCASSSRACGRTAATTRASRRAPLPAPVAR